MKALVLTDYFKFEYKDVPLPEYGDDEVLVKVGACSICGSDVHGYDGGSGRRQPPIIMGHEASGEIAAVGKAVTAFKKGDRVTFDSTVYCGKCYYCRKGMVNLCTDRRVLGVACDDYRQQGAMAEYVTVKERTLYKIPDNVTFEQAAAVEPLSVAVHAVSVSPIKLGDKVVVVGAGTIGLLITQVVKAAGATTLIVADIDDGKLEMAKKFGATHVVNSNEQNVAEFVRELTDGRGADLAFEAVGIPTTFSSAVESVRLGGNVVMVGNVTKELPMPLQKCVTQQIGLHGSCASAGEYDICLDMIANHMVDVDSIISKVAPLEDGGQWFDRLYAAEPGLIKVVLKP
jgi:alcohol dehydrogenase groES domain protein